MATCYFCDALFPTVELLDIHLNETHQDLLNSDYVQDESSALPLPIQLPSMRKEDEQARQKREQQQEKQLKQQQQSSQK